MTRTADKNKPIDTAMEAYLFEMSKIVFEMNVGVPNMAGARMKCRKIDDDL